MVHGVLGFLDFIGKKLADFHGPNLCHIDSQANQQKVVFVCSAIFQAVISPTDFHNVQIHLALAEWAAVIEQGQRL